MLLAQNCNWWNSVPKILSPIIILFKGGCLWFGLKYADNWKPSTLEELGTSPSFPSPQERAMLIHHLPGTCRGKVDIPQHPTEWAMWVARCCRMQCCCCLCTPSSLGTWAGRSSAPDVWNGSAVRCFRTKVKKFACGFLCFFRNPSLQNSGLNTHRNNTELFW